jgi:hypothetical protein
MKPVHSCAKSPERLKHRLRDNQNILYLELFSEGVPCQVDMFTGQWGYPVLLVACYCSDDQSTENRFLEVIGGLVGGLDCSGATVFFPPT